MEINNPRRTVATPRPPVMRAQAYERFMENLTLGNIKPGQLVSQRELCELLDVPMGPMREALKRLEAEDFVSVVPQRGIRIIDLDGDIIDEVYQFRRLIEREALRTFLNDVPIEAVRDLLDRTVEASKLEFSSNTFTIYDSLFMTNLDHEMHLMFVESLNNRFIYASFRRLMRQLRLVRYLNRIRFAKKHASLEEHVIILTRILENKAQCAEEALTSHLDASHERAKGMI